MIRNFLFHRVSPERDLLWDPMDVNLFEKCIKFISKEYEVVLLEDLVTDKKINSNKNFATIVFDDGYKDNIVYAAPVLAKYNVKASFYIVTECIDKNIPTWTHVLEHLFQYSNIDAIDIHFDFLPATLHITELKNTEAKLNYVKKLKPELKKVTHEERNIVMNCVTSTFKDVTLPELMMNWEDISQLKAAGHYIGSHTVSHCMLGTMTDEKEISAELIQSGNSILKHLGYFPKTISYPVGSYNDTTIRLSKAAGYSIGLAVKQDVYNPLTDSIFEIPRIELYNEPWWKTRLRISNSLEKIKKIIHYK
ncbi:MAG: polysaccharide deacetylase family protein [Bacteroidetes bacterium]|nr:polysaccharide deacetylase family protein [Bacteroidota bacterium]